MKPTTTDVINTEKRQALLAIAAAHDGVLNPQSIVDAARDKKHPLHNEFEWNDGLAAEGFRIAQAGALVRRMRLTVVRTDPQTNAVTVTLTREFQSRPSQRGSEGGYESVQVIMADSNKKTELLESVAAELRSIRERHRSLQELSEVWSAIDHLT